MLAAIGLLGLLRWSATLPVLLLGAAAYAQTQPNAGVQVVYGQFFLAGAVLSQFRTIWLGHAAYLLLGALVSAWLLQQIGHPSWAALLAVPIASISLGSMSTPVLRRFGRFGDISYGVYIYAFPIQQTVTQFGVRRAGWSFEAGLLAAMLITYLMGALSWHLVEKPSLKFKPSTPRQSEAAA